MRIDSSTIGMESSRRYSAVAAKTTQATRSTTIRNGAEWKEGLGGLFGNLLSTGEDTEQTAEEENSGMNLQDLTMHFRNVSNSRRVAESREERDAAKTIKQQCIEFLMELLFRFRGENYSNNNVLQPQSLQPLMRTTMTYSNQYYRKEEECTNFSTTGMVKTADGREISFNLDFAMSRSFEEYYEENYSVSSISYCDPLVINLDTNIAQVSDQKFFFDLDADGEKEEISNLKAGSGFLALDLNEDGVINDGSELFGTKSGNGFEDLAKHDADGNGWIDESDPIWEKLLVWTKDEDGSDKLYHLSELGIGAIGLSNISTEFALNSEQDNQNNAMIRNTGIFLYENGTVSTVQHLDLAR